MPLHVQGFLTLFERDFPLFIFANPTVTLSCQTQSSCWNHKGQWQVIVKASNSSQSYHHFPCARRWPAALGEAWPAFPFLHAHLCWPNYFLSPRMEKVLEISGIDQRHRMWYLASASPQPWAVPTAAGTPPCLEVWVSTLHGPSSQRLRFHNPTSSLCYFSPRLVTASCVYFCIP